jgi:single-strand DNA-binding protein
VNNDSFFIILEVEMSVNKVTLIGNLGSDPALTYMPSGGAVVNGRLATNEHWKDSETGETSEHTEWHNITFFNKRAEIVAEYLNKGSHIYIEGRLRTRSWTDDKKIDRYRTEIICSDVQFLDKREQ